MSRFNKFLVAAFMSAAMLLPSMVQAMEIRQFDKMADQDQADYTVALINGAEKILTDEGRPDLAAQVAGKKEAVVNRRTFAQVSL